MAAIKNVKIVSGFPVVDYSYVFNPDGSNDRRKRSVGGEFCLDSAAKCVAAVHYGEPINLVCLISSC